MKKINSDNLYLFKWIALIALCLIFGGVISFSLILITINLIEGSLLINPIWIVGMIPMMVLVAIPVTLLVYRQLVKHLTPLIIGMAKVADGDLNTYLPTATAKDFAKVYANFNKMVTEIQKSEELRTTMLDNLSHELKTPIASINGFAKILNEKELTQEKQRKYLDIIIVESERLDKLVKNILLLSKLDAQEIVTNKEKLNLKGQLQDCIISLEPEWANKNINIEASLIDSYLNGDFELVKSIWINLLSNAIKFTPTGGEITISVTEDNQNIFINISDNGIGINEQDLPHIFERHYQSDKSHNIKGQGLGLAIVKQAVRLCHGKISVTSKKDEGSSFIVQLPKNI